eukprot:516556_1
MVLIFIKVSNIKVLQDPNIMGQLLAMMVLEQMNQASVKQGGGGGSVKQGGGGGSVKQGGGGGGAMPNRPGVPVIQVTQEEKSAIDRLTAMGFSQNQAVEAYMVCGKNEQMAADYLFDNPDFK